jgi:hypothetical protein
MVARLSMNAGVYISELRRELGERARNWARGWAHVESYGEPPVIVFSPEGGRHGNFFGPSYEAICERPDWVRRFDKIHAQGRSLPRAESGPNGEAPRRWRELDSSMSSDALLMNVFCAPGVADDARVRAALGVEGDATPEFGWKARVPLKNGRFDRTEVDLRWGGLLVEAKLTEGDFQSREAAIVEGYRDSEDVFDKELLPRVAIRKARRKQAVEFVEEFTQEWEDVGRDEAELREAEEVAREFQTAIVERAREAEPFEAGYRGYQLIRNVLAAYAQGSSFCVIHDERRPDLREMWFEVMAAVKIAEMRVRCKVLTWQELAGLVPGELGEFLEAKYGIVADGMLPQ